MDAPYVFFEQLPAEKRVEKNVLSKFELVKIHWEPVEFHWKTVMYF